MCGRYRRTTREEELARIYRIPIPAQRDLPISYNIAPNQPVLAIRYNPETKQRSLDTLLWGLVPYWSKDDKTGFINARAERIDTAPAFRRPFHKRRREELRALIAVRKSPTCELGKGPMSSTIRGLKIKLAHHTSHADGPGRGRKLFPALWLCSNTTSFGSLSSRHPTQSVPNRHLYARLYSPRVRHLTYCCA
jgi:SOS response associated peptidase (SRAP)